MDHDSDDNYDIYVPISYVAEAYSYSKCTLLPYINPFSLSPTMSLAWKRHDGEPLKHLYRVIQADVQFRHLPDY